MYSYVGLYGFKHQHNYSQLPVTFIFGKTKKCFILAFTANFRSPLFEAGVTRLQVDVSHRDGWMCQNMQLKSSFLCPQNVE